MKNLNKIIVVITLAVLGVMVFSTEAHAVSAGPATCSVSSGSASMSPGGVLDFSVSSNRQSGEYVFVTAKDFQAGMYSDASGSKTILPGNNSTNFKVFALSNANPGNYSFKVYCTTSCPVSGCPSGGASEVIGEVPISVTVTGVPVSGGTASGGSGGVISPYACSVDSLILPPNSSDRAGVGGYSGGGMAPVPSFSTRNIYGSGLSTSPFPKSAKDWGERLSPYIRVQTGSDFSGQASYELSCRSIQGLSTVIGNVSTPSISNSSGKVKLTQIKDLKEILFPTSECPAGVSGCRDTLFTDSAVAVLSGANYPALVGTDLLSLFFGSAKGNTAHTRLFNLIDPLNPVDSGLTGEISTDDANGDFGPALRLTSAAYSKDGKFWAGIDSQYKTYIWKDGKRYGPDFGGDTDQKVEGIIKYGFSYILLTRFGSADITSGMKTTKHNLPACKLEGASSNCGVSYSLSPAPVDFPSLPNGDKFILGDDKYILTVGISNARNSGGTRKLAIYSVDSPNVIAEQNLPSSLGSGSVEKYGIVSVAGAEYIYLLKSPPQLINVYKFDYNTKKITEVVKDVALSSGYVTANAAFGTNTSNPGIVLFGSTSVETKIQVHLISDLIQGKGSNTLSNSPVWKDNTHSPKSATSLTVDGTTYVYTDDARVYKLELGTVSGGTPPSTTSPIGGGTTPTYPSTPTQPQEDVAGCPGGTVYQTSAGKLCVNSSGGVTTTTSFNFDTTVVQQDCFGWNAYSTSSGTKCANYSTTLNSTNAGSENGYNFGASTLKEGSTGEAVKELQRFLNKELSLNLAIDGKMGPNTVAAVKQWQSAHGLVPDGVVGPKTKAAMNAVLQQ